MAYLRDLGYAAQRDALLDALIPPGTAGLPGLAELDLDAFWERWGRVVPPQLALGLRAAVWGLALAPPFVLGRWCSAAGLGLEERARLLAACGASRFALVRQLVTALKLVGCLAYAGQRDVRRGVLVEEPARW